MPFDPELVASLEGVLDSGSGNEAIRAHLIDLLLEGERFDPALERALEGLRAAPTHRGFLAAAERASRALGKVTEADGYRDLLAALDANGASAVTPPTNPADASDDLPATRVPADPLDRELQELLAGELDDPVRRVTLDDVGGLEDVKRRLERSFLAPLRNPELRQFYGKSVRGGLLLYGPPGCGKTFLARAVAGELDAQFLSVGLHDVLDMWMGQSEAKVHALFERARRSAPCVLFLDEVDALGQSRAQIQGSAARNVVVQLLTELDGVDSDNEGLFVLAASNQPWAIDPALRRPGRLDRSIVVLPPDAAARAAILRYHLRDRPVEALDLARLVRETDGFSGADLRLVCEEAAELAIEDSIDLGRPRPIDTGHLQRALSSVRTSTRAWFDLARSVVMFGNGSGEYDDLASYMRERRLL